MFVLEKFIKKYIKSSLIQSEENISFIQHRIELGHTEFISECPKPKQKENKIQKRPFVSLEFSNQNCAKSREIVAE